MLFYKKIVSRFRKKDGIFFIKLEKLLGFAPKNLRYYEEAFTHPAVKKAQGTPHISYERLEFLGDAVLGAVIAHYLFTEAPNENEGYLTKMRAKMVQRNYLNQIGEELKLKDFLKNENKPNLLGGNITGNLFEALVGAIYLDQGYQKATQFIYRVLINSHINIKELEGKIISYKSLLVEWSQKQHKTIVFETDQDYEYSSNIKYFVSKLIVNDKVFAKARDTSKKKAEEKTAKRAFFKITGTIRKKKSNKNTKKLKI
ncbi:ribonuclease III [Capnocytophaga catalasegens]|uniref:Ribonuclease 3 n=1 Tax=Capnocytophaga catalasegens TaxID=1004260 RepID=A0AAV5AW54_9FLAO|nr:ribonuclease III [Capnocytophaga catalasegens]GIZ14242.1 ribonuclease 3 [Capnocytophaga catalasegens]GJM49585.1 ribonuclease 3 [Capnocytophaga catalasegens]GJM52932.1 ribonuclease 3 [Capnocytophaga catalasegens]